MQAINILEDENQDVQSETGKIVEIFIKYYQNLLGGTGGGRIKKVPRC